MSEPLNNRLEPIQASPNINPDHGHRENGMIRFIGKVHRGVGKHSALVIPGAADLQGAPAQWPVGFYPGSLNVAITNGGYPEGFTDPDEGGGGVATLDDGVIEPTVVLPPDRIANNNLRPTRRKPRRGTGQFWPAVMGVLATGDTVDCWLFRRVDSTIKRQLEIVSSLFLRTHLALTDGTEVSVDVFGKKERRHD